MLRHKVFIETFGKINDRHSDWLPLTVGFLVLRLFDDWAEHGPSFSVSQESAMVVFRAIEQLADSHKAEWAIMTAIFDRLTHPAEHSALAICAPLLAFAKTFEHRRQWPLAADVYDTVATVLQNHCNDNKECRETVCGARLRQGFCLRTDTNYVDARAAYHAAFAYAKFSKLPFFRLKARLGIANMHRARGNLSGAERLLESLLNEASHVEEPIKQQIVPQILHTRGSVRHARANFAGAISDFFTAYTDTSDPDSKELILVDLGAAAFEAGYVPTAKLVFNFVARTGNSPLAKQTAIVNLIDISVKEANELAFQYFRNQWKPTEAVPLVVCYARLYIARGLLRFGARDDAIKALKEAAAFAEGAGIHQAQFEALHDLERLELENVSPGDPSTPLYNPMPEPVAQISKALEDLFTLAER